MSMPAALSAGEPDAPLHHLPERQVILSALRWQAVGFKSAGWTCRWTRCAGGLYF
jgi:hypothetical protein